MEVLKWDNFSGEKFQKFCNALLLFTVSKFAHVFSTAGKDGGVDQLFTGLYEGKTGKWRFQDKFHNSGKKTADVSALKRDILLDIKNNYTDENYIVYITNVNLNPSKHKEISGAAQKLLEELHIDNAELLIWHEATLEGLLANYPVLNHWFWGKESVILQPYEQYFSNQLLPETNEIRNQLKNDFFGRGKELAELADFMANAKVSSLAIIANGGYGKTRLAIEFFRTILSETDEWIPLVMSHVGFNASDFTHLLKSKKRILIFIDNAHEIPDTVSEVKRQIDNTHGKDKLLLTTRPALFSEIIEKLPSHGKNMEKLVLSRLPYDETKKMFKYELPWLTELHIIRLAEISKGVPNVILELTRLVKLGKKPNEIAAEGIFNQSVEEIFSEAINDIENKTHIPKEKAHDFLRLVALISPVTNDELQKGFISEVVELRIDRLELLINELSALNLLESGQTISIKPDPYSDSILVETIKKNFAFIERVRNFNGAERYFENILKNLSEAEIAGNEKEYFIDGLLNGYVRLLLDPWTENIKIKNIYEFVEKIVIFKPYYGVFVIKQFFNFHDDAAHSIHSESDKWNDKSFYTEIGELTYKILSILCTYSKYSRDNKEELFSLVEKFIKATGNFKLLGDCYGFHAWDFPYFQYRPRKCCENQLFLKSIICNYLQAGDDLVKINIALAAAGVLLELEFELGKFYEPATMQIHFGHGQVPYCKHVVEVRTDILKALIAFHDISGDAELKEKAFALLLPYIFYSSKNFSLKHKQDINKEIYIVFDFFNIFLDNTPSSYEKNKILSKIQTFERVEFRDEFQDIVSILKIKAGKTDSLYQALEMNLINKDYFDVRDNMEARLLKLIDQYGSLKAFEADLLKIQAGIKTPHSNFRVILSLIAKLFPEGARLLFKDIQNKHTAFIDDSVYLLGDSYKDEEYFYSIIEWLWIRKDNHLNTFFWLLSWGRNKDKKYYKISDLDYYEYIIENNLNSHALHDYISFNLIDYAYLDKDRTFSLLDKFFQAVHLKDLDHINFTLFDKKEKYEKDFKNEIKELFYNNRDKIDLENSHNQFLYFLESYFGFEELFSFINDVIDVALKSDEYKYFNFERQFYRNHSLSQEENITRFIRVFKWYILNYEENPKKQDFVISIFRPGSIITKELHVALTRLINDNSTDSNKLVTIARGLQPFAQINEEWINIISEIADRITMPPNHGPGLTQIFGSTFYHNTGSKSKVGIGIPFNEDQSKKELLEKIIMERRFGDPVISYLDKCLANVNLDIDNEIKSDTDELSW